MVQIGIVQINVKMFKWTCKTILVFKSCSIITPIGGEAPFFRNSKQDSRTALELLNSIKVTEFVQIDTKMFKCSVQKDFSRQKLFNNNTLYWWGSLLETANRTAEQIRSYCIMHSIKVNLQYGKVSKSGSVSK